MCRKKLNRKKITRSIEPENYEKLRKKAFMTRKTEGEILDDLLRGI